MLPSWSPQKKVSSPLQCDYRKKAGAVLSTGTVWALPEGRGWRTSQVSSWSHCWSSTSLESWQLYITWRKSKPCFCCLRLPCSCPCCFLFLIHRTFFLGLLASFSFPLSIMLDSCLSLSLISTFEFMGITCSIRWLIAIAVDLDC